MDEAKRRGSQADRISQTRTRLDALRPGKLVCGACQTAFTEFGGTEPRDMLGVHTIFGGECSNCGESVISFSGESGAMAAAMLACKDAMEDAKLGMQTQEGKHLPYVDEEDKPTQH